MADDKTTGVGAKLERKPIRVLLLDDREENLLLRATILRQKGYHVLTASTIEAAEQQLGETDIAVLDYHLGAGKFGTHVAEKLRQSRPEVPIIILSATLERKFGGVEDMHLLKGHSSVDDMVAALRSFEGKKQGKPIVVDAREFFYSRISMAMGEDVVLEIMDREGTWQYVNDYFATLFDKKRQWFFGKNLFEQFPEMGEDWRENIRTVADTRETYIDRSFRGVPHLPATSSSRTWNVIMFSLKLHNSQPGVVLSARIIPKK
jgi:two-component system, OmpR family, response regulator